MHLVCNNLGTRGTSIWGRVQSLAERLASMVLAHLTPVVPPSGAPQGWEDCKHAPYTLSNVPGDGAVPGSGGQVWPLLISEFS